MAERQSTSVSIDGKVLEFRSIRAAAKHFGKNIGTTYGRMRVGWTVEEALELVPKTGTCVVCGGEFVHPLKYSKPDKKFCSQRCADKTRDRDHANAMQRSRRKKDPEKYRDMEREYLEKNPSVKEKKRKSLAARYWKNRDRLVKQHTAWEAEQMKTNPLYALQKRLRDRLRKAIKNNYKAGSAVRDLGCSIEFLKDRLESMFRDGMSWGNYGTVWVIDHIFPIAAADMNNRIEFLAVNNWKNLQPLPTDENLEKGDKVFPEAQVLFDELCDAFKDEEIAA